MSSRTDIWNFNKNGIRKEPFDTEKLLADPIFMIHG